MAQELYHPEFARAGQQAGLQVWRIEKLELVPVPERAHGDFYVGDAYLVLHTAKASRGFIYRLHFWLGKGRQAARPRRAQVGERRGRERLRVAGSERVGREAGVQTGRACSAAAPLRPHRGSSFWVGHLLSASSLLQTRLQAKAPPSRERA